MTDRMRCIEIAEPGGPEVLLAVERPRPEPARGEILVEVAAAGVNRADLLQRLGHYPPPSGASDLPGLEVSGHVAALGDGVDGWELGAPVCALLAGGGYAEYVAVPAGQCLPVPAGVDLVDAGGLPEAVFTVFDNVLTRGRLRNGETFLVHGGTSGIGTTAIQIARAFGARVYATAGTPEKCRAAEELGAERCIDYRTEDFVEVLRQATNGHGVDVILDMVGGDYLSRNLAALAVEGRLVHIAAMAGSRVELNILDLMVKRLTVTGSTLRARSVEQKSAVAREVYQHVWPLVEAGAVRPIIDATFSLADAPAAHRSMEEGGHIGKILLVTDRGRSA